MTANQTVIWVSTQILREILAVLTRPGQFEQDISPLTATRAVKKLLPILQIVEVTTSVTENLLEIMTVYDVKGKQVHDADIVATMQIYGLSNLLTEVVVHSNGGGHGKLRIPACNYHSYASLP